MEFKRRTLAELADMICGNCDQNKERLFQYRSSSALTRFFQDCDTDYAHDGSTRNSWVHCTLIEIFQEPQPEANTPPDTFSRVIRTLMDKGDATEADQDREKALALLNASLGREGFEAFYGSDDHCYLRHTATNKIAQPSPNPAPAFFSCGDEKARRSD